MTLNEAPFQKPVCVLALLHRAAIRQRLLDLGLTPGCEVTVCAAAPLGDPLELFLRGYRLTLRRADAMCILVEPAPARKVAFRL